MDKTDEAILKLLVEDARLPWRQLAKAVGLSDTAVQGRVRRLVESGIIRGFRAVFDYSRLGWTVAAFLEISAKSESIDEVVEQLKDTEGVAEIHEIHGKYDLLVKIYDTSLENLRNKLVKDIRRIPGVESIETLVILRTALETPPFLTAS